MIFWTAFVLIGAFWEIQALASGDMDGTFTNWYARTFALDEQGKSRRFWRVRRAFGALFPVWLLLHMLGQAFGGLI